MDKKEYEDYITTLEGVVALYKEENERLYGSMGDIVMENNNLKDKNEKLFSLIEKNNRRIFKRKIDIKSLKEN